MPRPHRYSTMYERLIANTREEGDCWIWTGPTDSGYPRVTIRTPDKPHPVKVAAHRLMLEIVTEWYFPHDEAGHYVCMNPLCIRPCHLRIETQAENLSSRRGYAPCDGRLIPVLYPTPARLMDEAAERAWDMPGAPGGAEAPF